ncbi:MAG: transposase [Acidobacteria bacterium]|nr:transposase [Acidobacteriota bacterium]
MKKRFTEAQIVGVLLEADAGLPVKDLCRKHEFSESSYSRGVASSAARACQTRSG